MIHEHTIQKYINKIKELDKRVKKLEEASERATDLGEAESILQTAKVANMLTYATGYASGKLIKKKILPEYFEKVVSGEKTFEIRKDEDDIQPGDTLDLLEWDQDYTGKNIRCQVTYVLRNCPEYGLMDGYCIIGIEAVGAVVAAEHLQAGVQMQNAPVIDSLKSNADAQGSFTTPGIISREDLMFTGDLEDDRTNVYVSLDDYDWMQYAFTTRFRTMEYGQLNVSIEYFGSRVCTMDVKQTTPSDHTVVTYRYRFPSELFIKHYSKYLNAHMTAMNRDNDLAFNGETLILDFYNDIIKNSKDEPEILTINRMNDEEMGIFVRTFEKCMNSEETRIQKSRYWESTAEEIHE